MKLRYCIFILSILFGCGRPDVPPDGRYKARNNIIVSSILKTKKDEKSHQDIIVDVYKNQIIRKINADGTWVDKPFKDIKFDKNWRAYYKKYNNSQGEYTDLDHVEVIYSTVELLERIDDDEVK